MDIPNSPRRSLFAVWRWPRWTWVIVVVLMAGYPLSYPLARYHQESNIRWVEFPGGIEVYRKPLPITYAPLIACDENIPVVKWAFNCEFELIKSVLGEPKSAPSLRHQ